MEDYELDIEELEPAKPLSKERKEAIDEMIREAAVALAEINR